MTEVQTRDGYLRAHAERRTAVVEMRSRGMSYDEISEQLGGTANAAKLLMKRARELGEAPRYDPSNPPPRRRGATRAPRRRMPSTTRPIEPPQDVDADIVALDDTRLTYAARGVLVHLLVTHPPEVQISAKSLARAGSEGPRAMRTLLHELEAHGYLRRGRGTAWVWLGDPTRRLA